MENTTMHQKSVLTLTLLLTLGLTGTVLAMPGMEHGGSHETSSMTGHDMGGSHDDLATLGEQTVDGVKAAAMLGDVRAAMAAAGQPMTHHLQILFTDLAAKKTIEAGTVAVKVTTPAGEVLPSLSMHGMEGHFGVDLTLAAGTYKFAVGTKLADGKKRQFEFTAVVK
jgi:hypothetical protein